jgi:Tol biopolymer transport system component
MRLFLSSLGAIVVSALLVLACGRFGDEEPSSAPDAATAEVSADGALGSDTGEGPDAGDGSCWTRRFGAPVFVPQLSSDAIEVNVRLSPDERTAFVASNRDGGLGGVDLYTSTRPTRTDPFNAPSPLALNTVFEDTHPSLSFDGLALYFGSTRPDPDGGTTATNIYVSRRGTSTLPFVGATYVPELSGPSDDSFPYSAPSGGIYFASTRLGEMDLFFAAPAGASFGVPVPIENAHEPGTISNLPVSSADGLWLYFASSRTSGGAKGELDIWVMHRASLESAFGPPVNVEELNTTSSDRPSWISGDGCRIYLTSTREGGIGNLDVWRAER